MINTGGQASAVAGSLYWRVVNTNGGTAQAKTRLRWPLTGLTRPSETTRKRDVVHGFIENEVLCDSGSAAVMLQELVDAH